VWFFSESAFSPSHQPEDFFDGRIGLSGTDGTLLRVAAKLGTARHEVSLFNYEWSGPCRGLEFVRIETVEDLKPSQTRAAPDVMVFQCSVESMRKVLVHFSNSRKLFWDQIGVDYRFLDLVASRQLDELICVSGSARELFRSTSAYQHTRSIYNLSDDIYLKPEPRKPDGKTVLFVGALRPEKGFDRLALAWPIVYAAFPDARLVVAGSISLHHGRVGAGVLGLGDYQTKVIAPFQEWAKRARADVVFLGAVGARELLGLHPTSVACVVNPLGGETFCCAAVEAQLCGNPVVSVCAGALPEVTEPGMTSLLVERDSAQALAEAILRLLRKPAEVDAMGKAARRRAMALFGPEPIMAAWEKALLGQPPGENQSGCVSLEPETG
jgi:glycosyltransferase involved in cell wall biosynthesis